ncbi:MAG: hypothetical protein IPJ65_28640 [Archangiaceae bacterium]|nr:hypothetical protein [Archangiaceae bacterium]
MAKVAVSGCRTNNDCTDAQFCNASSACQALPCAVDDQCPPETRCDAERFGCALAPRVSDARATSTAPDRATE